MSFLVMLALVSVSATTLGLTIWYLIRGQDRLAGYMLILHLLFLAHLRLEVIQRALQ